MTKASFRIYFIATDWIAAFISWCGLYLIRHIFNFPNQGSYFSLLYSAVPIATFWLLVYGFCGCYKDVLRKSRVRELLFLVRINILGFIIFSTLFVYLLLAEGENLANYQKATQFILYYAALHMSFTFLGKLFIMSWSKKLLAKKILHFRTIIIGSGAAAQEVLLDLENSAQHLGLKFNRFLTSHLTHLGNYLSLESIIQQNQIEQVVIAIEKHEHSLLQEILTLIEGHQVRTGIIPDIYQIMLGSVKISQLFGTPLIEIKTDLMPVWQQVLKRIIDITASLMVLILGFPFLFIVALITKYTSKGPIFYFQERVGKGGKPFNIIKFRSMFIDAEKMGPSLSSSHDPRVTKWGRIMRKTRLDEFPQFYNVLIGEMSLVGPRPERQYFIDKITEIAPHYKHLNRVRPGITSLGQVKFGYAEDVPQMVRRLKYDILYIENMSIALDFRILFYPVFTVLKGSGK
jgi:exopolysaccharide biosynthesis polyprenyl glycosylphosphotransferase